MGRTPVSISTFCRLLLIVGGTVLLGLGSGEASAKTTRLSPGEWRAIQTVIAKQMDAFRLDNGDVAFSLASPKVRRVFESADNFMEMVRAEYSAVYQPRSYRFLKPSLLDGEPLQAVEVIALDGAVSIAVFSMERQPNRSWRISGCYMRDSKQFAT